MSDLGFGDWLVIAAYLAGILAFGLWSGRGQKSTRDYFLGKEDIPWWGVGLSIVATETSALTFISVPAMAYGGNLALLQIIIGYVIARVILALVLVPHYFKGEIYSAYQLIEHAFGPPARRMAGVCFLLSCTLGAGVRVFVTCIPIQLMLGVDILTAILIFVGFTLVYTSIGGIRSVVWTDAAQFVLFTVGGLFTLCYVPTLVEGGWAGALRQAAAAGKLHWLDTSFSAAAPFNLWMGLFGATVQVLFSHGADQMVVQQVLTCKSVRNGRRALILSAMIIFPLFLVFLLTGVLLWVYDGQFNLRQFIPNTTGGLKQNDYIYPLFILKAVPPWLKGFLIVAILSAAMSSVSSALAALSSVSTMDILKTLSRQPRSEQFYLRFSKGATVFWCAALVAVAFASRQAPLVYNLAFTLTGLTSGAMLGAVLLAVFWKQGRSRPVLAGMVASLVVMAGVSQYEWPVRFEDRRGESPLLRLKDLSDPAGLADRLAAGRDAASTVLRSRLQPSTVQLLEASKPSERPSAGLKEALVEELNRVIAGPPFYEDDRLARTGLSPETARLVSRQPKGADVAFLNRLWLADQYRAAIARYPVRSVFWPWYTFIGTLVTVAVALTAGRFTGVRPAPVPAPDAAG